MDKTRPEAMYFIGIHHYLENNKYQAYEYIKKAFEIGYDFDISRNLDWNMGKYLIPVSEFIVQVPRQMSLFER